MGVNKLWGEAGIIPIFRSFLLLLRPHQDYTGEKFEKRRFISTVRPTVHTNP